MALAILRFQDSYGAKSRFQVDIGVVNRFYVYAIGKEELQRSQRFKVLSAPKFTSPLIGPLPESNLGRTNLEVPNQEFDRQNRQIQIISYRNQQRDGPAISEIVRVPLISSGNHDLPVISFSQETNMKNHPVDTVPFAYKEVQSVSSAMFLGALLKAVAGPVLKAVAGPVLNALKTRASPLLNLAAPAIGKLAAGGLIPDTVSQSSAEIQNLVKFFSNPSNLQTLFKSLAFNPNSAKKLVNFLKDLATTQTPQSASPLAVVGHGRVQDSDNSLLSLEQKLIPGTLPPSLSTTKAVSTSQYVEEISVPVALATCVPSLMPLMEKVTPRRTREMLMDHHLSERKRIGLITNSLMDFLKSFQAVSRNYRGRGSLGMEASEAFSLIEADGNKEVNALVQGLGIGLSAPNPTLDYQRVESVKLEFTKQTTVMMQGRSRLLYRQDHTFAFPLEVETPRPITRGILQIVVKDPSTLEVLIEQKYRLNNITSGSLSVVPKLSPQRLRSLEPNEEYLICAVLVWQAKSRKTKRKKRLGTSMSQLITLVGEYCFDGIEGTDEVVALNDVDRFRPYWHKIWEGEFMDNIRRTRLDCKYYYALEPGRTNHARMETVTQIEPTDGTREAGKLKTGLILSAYRLNELLGQIPAYPLLDEDQLTALMSSEFQEQFSYCARNSVEFKGRRGDVVGLWVYPEFKLQRVLLKQVEQTNCNGQVLGLAERAVYFPMPGVVHFVGVGS